MSHTPLDGPQGGSRDGETSVEAARDGEVSRFVGRVRRALNRASEALQRLVGRNDRQETRVDEDPKPDRPTEQSIATAGSDTTRDRPVVVDRDGGPALDRVDREPRAQPELVAHWHDGRLTLSEPDQAGAQISSDTWAEVDP
jgi:hypothetical protein